MPSVTGRLTPMNGISSRTFMLVFSMVLTLPEPTTQYNLRNRPGINKTLLEKTVDLNDRDFYLRAVGRKVL